jgi:two-component system sensor histidine kinase/response regulator
MVIYQLDTSFPASLPSARDLAAQPAVHSAVDVRHFQDAGCVAYESRSSQQIASVLNLTDPHCLVNRQLHQLEAKSAYPVRAIADIEVVYQDSPCLVEFLQQVQVRAELIAPIVVQEKLWGLLIAHECFTPRLWLDREKTFMQHIAEHLAIAIRQARLYAQLQQQKATLEQRVIERTRDLHDALLAAQAADQAKSEFLATMSHELRTPLTCVIGMSATLLRWSFGELNQRQRTYIQTIHDSGERLLELINDILDMSQVEAGRIILDSREFAISGLVSQTLEALQDQAQQNQVQLKLDSKVNPGQDLFVADPRRLRQILLNLLTNAIKFTPAGGTVCLKVRPDAEAMIFQVEDTGIGISPEQRPFLFRKFQQLDSSRQRSYEGMGLGLALTKQLVDLHGGQLEVKSEVGVGSIFTVRIPSQRVSEATDTADQRREVLPLSQRVVLFEEDEEAATVICDMLMAAGHQVIWMVDSTAVLEQVDLVEPNMVMIGFNLSSLDGQNIIHQLRQRLSVHPLKILALVEDGSEATKQQCLKAGADDCVAKPVQPQMLLHKINTLFYSPLT